MDRDAVIAPRMVEALIAEGQTIVIFEEYVLRLDSWLEKHPGGRLAIMHMVGRDATDEIKVYHSAKTCRTMKAFRIGRKQGPWVNMTPPIRGGIFRPYEPLPAGTDSSDDSEIDTDEDRLDDDTISQTSTECSCENGVGHKALSPPAQDTGVRRRVPNSSASSCSSCKCPLPENSAAKQAASRSATIVKVANQGVLEEVARDTMNYPSIDPLVQQDITRKYRALHQRIRDEGLYECRYIEYGKEMMRYTALFVAFLAALRYEQYMVAAVLLGLFWHQIMFTAHDAGHCAITQKFETDALIGLFVADFCCGLSMGWWKSSHNVHHLITNQPEHDPDIQNVPLFATCPSFFKSLRSSYYDFTFVWDAAADFLVPYQKYTYYPVMGIARFNLYLLSWLHVLSKRSSGLGGSKAWWIRPTEIAFMSCYWFLFGYCLLWRTLPTWTIRVMFVLVSHIVTMPLHVQITLSHWGMSTVELGESESFPQRQLRTTMDVDCPAWLDFIHGGLQFQAIHHLFPRVPRHNLRKVQSMVREFCDETEIPYSILGFVKGNKKVLKRLQDVGDQLKLLLDCQRHMAETGDSGLH